MALLKKLLVLFVNWVCSDSSNFRSAFFWFCNDERSKVKGQNPEYGVGDIAKELGRRWADADPESKSKYEALAEKDKARYEKVSFDFHITSRYSICIKTKLIKIHIYTTHLCHGKFIF